MEAERCPESREGARCLALLSGGGRGGGRREPVQGCGAKRFGGTLPLPVLAGGEESWAALLSPEARKAGPSSFPLRRRQGG